MRHKLILLSAVSGSLFTLPAAAFDLGVTLSESSEYTTNSGRTERDEVEEWIHSPGIGVVANHIGPNLNLDVNYDLTRRIYQQDLFDDENNAVGSANLVWNALPERLDFTVNHTRTQSAINSINATTPDNRQETSNTRAGPTLRFNTRGDDEIQLEYFWGDRSSDDTDNDAITHDATLRYILSSSPTSRTTFEVSNNQVQFENPLIPDIEYKIGRIILDRESGQLDYTLSGGFNKTERTQNRDDVDGFIFDAEASWRARPTTTVTVNASRDLQDQSDNLDGGTFAQDLDFQVNSDLGEVFVSERFGLTIAEQLDGRTTVSLNANMDNEDYEDVGRDVERYSVGLDVNRRLNRRLNLNMGISVDNEDFSDQNDEADTLRGNLSLDYTLGRSVTLGFAVRYEERESDSGLNGRDYDEWAATLSITYEAIPLGR